MRASCAASAGGACHDGRPAVRRVGRPRVAGGGVVSLTVGSLFAGIGGFDLGFERAGFTVRWQVEIDPWCRRVLETHWPHVYRHDDVRTAGAHNLEAVDVLVGGFPCQDISVAGRGAGITGARSGLWREYARIIRELRPRYVVVENSPALLGRGLGRVLGDLAEIRYDAEWDCLPMSAFGANQQRDRIWIVAYPGPAEWRARHSDWGRDSRPHDHGHRSQDRQAAQGATVDTERGWPYSRRSRRRMRAGACTSTRAAKTWRP